MHKVVVLDTNVLLADPNVLFSYPRAEIVVPETVIGELDKLKTARVDPDLRFRGREVSRILFDLSEEGSLVDGVELPDGGSLRVVPFESDPKGLPEGMGTRNADERILATAYMLHKNADDDTEISLVTNDLNMLLKAQTFGVAVERHDDGVEVSFGRKYVLKPLQRYRVPIGILAVALAVFAAVIVVALYTQRTATSQAMPSEFKSLLSTQQKTALDALITLQGSPNDPESLLKMANYYFDAQTNLAATDPASALEYGRQGIRYYDRYLKVSPQDNDARADLASLLFYTGQTDRAIQEVGIVLQKDPNHLNANYNLGIFYGQGRHDYPAAIAQMQKVIALTQNDPQQHAAYQRAAAVLEQLKQVSRFDFRDSDPRRYRPMTAEHIEVAIIGGGPAGLAAGLYAARGRAKTVIFERGIPGGQIVTTDWVENYPGFPGGISGTELGDLMTKQAEEHGAIIRSFTPISSITVAEDGHFVMAGEEEMFEADAVIVATGAVPRKLGIPGEAEFTGRGVSWCATCDGALFKEKVVGVIGGGDAAVEEALFLTKFASKVHLIHRRDEFRATKCIQERCQVNPKIEEHLSRVPVEIVGADGKVASVRLESTKGEPEELLPLDGVFIFVGVHPVSELVRQLVNTNGNGYVTIDHDGRTSVPGLFAAGDVTDSELKQVVTAAAKGASAAFEALRYLDENATCSI